MKANELMIGDWVECTYWTPSKQLKVAEIRRIMDDEIKIGVYSDDLILIFRQSEVKPIPLTPEILEKNGFKLDKEDGWWWLTPKIGITFWKEGDIELEFENKHSSGNIHIKYLHQLQHVLKLCGIEKEIEL